MLVTCNKFVHVNQWLLSLMSIGFYDRLCATIRMYDGQGNDIFTLRLPIARSHAVLSVKFTTLLAIR